MKQLLREMVAEAEALREVAGGSVTDAVAAWLAPQYLLAAREKLAAADRAGHFEVLRRFVQDWATLRHGNHTEERLRIERQRLELSEQDAQKRWQVKIEAGLDALAEVFKQNPKLIAGYQALREQVRALEMPQNKAAFWEWLRQPEFRKEVLAELSARKRGRGLKRSCACHESNNRPRRESRNAPTTLLACHFVGFVVPTALPA